VVIDGDGQFLLRGVLTDHVLIQVLFQFQRLRELMRRGPAGLVAIVFQNRIAYGDAFVTNVSARVIGGGGDQFADNVLALMTKRTTE